MHPSYGGGAPSIYMFGVQHLMKPLTKREVARRARLCREHGGLGYRLVEDGPGRLTGYFYAENLGEAFCRAVARSVYSAMGWAWPAR